MERDSTICIYISIERESVCERERTRERERVCVRERAIAPTWIKPWQVVVKPLDAAIVSGVLPFAFLLASSGLRA